MEKKVIKHKKKLIINIKFDSEPVYGDNDKYIKTKIKIYDGNVNTNFQGKKVPKENVSYRCLPLIMLDYIVKVKKKYYPQALLEGCRYELKKLKWRTLSMMYLNQGHLMMKVIKALTMKSTMRKIMNLAMKLIMNLTMIHLLKVKIVFQ